MHKYIVQTHNAHVHYYVVLRITYYVLRCMTVTAYLPFTLQLLLYFMKMLDLCVECADRISLGRNRRRKRKRGGGGRRMYFGTCTVHVYNAE